MDTLIYEFDTAADESGVYLLADGMLKTVYLSPGAKDILGAGSVGLSLADHMSEADSFRLESFIKSRGKYGEISSMEVSFSHLCGFSFGYVSRKDFFKSPCVQIDLFGSRKDFLLSKRSPGSYCNIRSGAPNVLRKMELARSELEKIAAELPGQTSELYSAIDVMSRELLSAYLVQSVFENAEDYPVFDLCSAVELALRNATAESGREVCACDFSPKLLSGKCSRVRITAENLISLVTAIFSLSDSVAEGDVRFSAKLSDIGEFVFDAAAECPSVCAVLPDGAGLIELDSLIEGQSFRLFLCDLICTQYGCDVRIETDGRMLTLSFTVPPVCDEAEFKSRDMVSVESEHLKICVNALVEQSPDREKDREDKN